MSLMMIALIGLLLLFALMMFQMPISFAMFITGFIGMMWASSPAAAFNLLTSDFWDQFSSYSLSVIPLYILMGEIVFRAGITEKLFEAAYKWVGQFRGGMLSTVVLASAGFGAICGSNSATTATIGTIAMPELKKYKYDDALSTGSIAGAGTLGVIIPPSTVLLIIALQTQLSIKDLFVATIIPGLLLTFLFLGVIGFICYRNPQLGPAGPRTTWNEKFVSLSKTAPVFILFAFVIGGLFWGWFTPTESGALGTAGAMVISAAMRRFTFQNFKLALISTLRTSAMVTMLVVGAMVFGRFLTLTRLPFEVADWANSLPVPPFLVLLAILVVYAVGGALMDALGFLIITIPLFFPTVVGLGYDPVWIAIIFCIITSMGAITPPVGVNVFVVKGMVPNVPVTTIFKGANYYLLGYVLCFILLILFPWLVWY